MIILNSQKRSSVSKLAIILCVVIGIISCNVQQQELPYLGPRDISAAGDTIYHSIPDFAFVNQLGDTITQRDYDGKIYVSDFFFTSCPTICPVMKSQMLRVYEHFKDDNRVGILSHSIDPRHDTVEVLAAYSSNLGVEGDKWNFVTGDQDAIYEIAQKSYLTTALEDSTAIEEGGFIHSGAFLLIDMNKNVRGHYDGTVEDDVSQLIRDMELLLAKP